ncbi:MAG TPA: thiol reductase thioredoxin [Cyanobacteria bacterium UBA11991]|jgi:thioredoxin 1|nr:thioredoxin family protein [Cyanobacteriota bacterium]MDY6359126.1 thioredoxin family protein [Cyanobacteriota bacterium]MDY6363610.1 thioredoxin family protein [Cyanobacteriota bacterium]HCB11602.1 thiol reductase thioredoxin [Cyanobacteria bacterium UBA11991]
MIIELNEDNFDSEALSGLKVIEFYATWCMYCKKQRIELGELENSDIRIGIVDGDESPNLVKRYGIRAYPTFVILKDGEKIGQFSGFHTKAELLNRLMKYLQP